jgi:hypothetical protein
MSAALKIQVLGCYDDDDDDDDDDMQSLRH